MLERGESYAYAYMASAYARERYCSHWERTRRERESDRSARRRMNSLAACPSAGWPLEKVTYFNLMLDAWAVGCTYAHTNNGIHILCRGVVGIFHFSCREASPYNTECAARDPYKSGRTLHCAGCGLLIYGIWVSHTCDTFPSHGSSLCRITKLVNSYKKQIICDIYMRGLFFALLFLLYLLERLLRSDQIWILLTKNT